MEQVSPQHQLSDEYDSCTDTEAELATVGALMIAGPLIQREISAMVTGADFTDKRCAFAVVTAAAMIAADVPIDELTMAGYVVRHGLLDANSPRMSLRLFLHDAVVGAPVGMAAVWYARSVLEAAGRRRAVSAAHRLAAVATAGSLTELRRVLTDESGAVFAALDRVTADV